MTPRTLRAFCLVALIAALSLVLGAASSSAAPQKAPRRGPIAPASVDATAGADGIVAVVSWRPAARGASSYRVWRSTRSLRAFEPIGSTAATSFADSSGVAGRTYRYRVTAMLPDGSESAPSTETAAVTAGLLGSPHANYNKGNLCLTCHALHRGEGDDPSANPASEVALCESCHDGNGARSNVTDGATDSFALSSGHRVEESTRSADLTNECSSCHSPHGDSRTRPGLFRKKVNTKAVKDRTEWCAACHDDKGAWRKDLPSVSKPERDAAGYPVLGTFPGPAVYGDSKKNGHAGIPAAEGRPKGDCLRCHAAHRGPNAYDGLLMTFRPPSAATVASDQAEATYAQLCLNCHAGAKEWTKAGAADIERYVTRSFAGRYEGHSIVTSGGVLPVGAPLPCYECHNPHGSARGNASLISDALGADLGTRDATSVRAFCLSCHSSSDGMVWASEDEKYEAAGDAEFLGLRRDGEGGNLLRLPAAEDAHAAASERSCYECHGDDVSSEAGYNVHAPRRGAVPPVPVSRPGGPVGRSEDKTATLLPAPSPDPQASARPEGRR